MKFEEIKDSIHQYLEQGKSVFTTSSFQTHSMVLLHMLSKIDKSIPVYFINTGYLFPETISYKNQIAELFGVNVISVYPSVPKAQQKDLDGNFLFTSNPDLCCHINKVEALAQVLSKHDVWINGVRADQSATRKNFNLIEHTPQGNIRFHPMLDWNSMMIQKYIHEHNIPRHPLEEKGYMSIGCEPCTKRFSGDLSEREVRWFGLNKTECGLNTELVAR